MMARGFDQPLYILPCDHSRGAADGADTLLSAMRYEFGGYLEKSET